ncbi:right-handed parallel beta-helix repeat-containing protein [Microbulbifer sp. EKSA008]|uniref:right-handed parallel beta-helix repeat-containing protein n=1 Tax=unclassified Microbulbifer TaxID=2619833 RepID=UPI0039B4D5A8
MKKPNLTLFLSLLSTLGLPLASNSFAVSCGDTITTQESLTEDLSCETNPALTIDGPGGGLNLNGFTVTCIEPLHEGIYLTGLAASLFNGVIDNCNDSIALTEDGVHFVSDIEINNLVGVGVRIESNSNFVTGIVIPFNGTQYAIGIETANPASLNQITGNFLEFPGFSGIYIEGRSNTVTGNEILNPGDFGIALDSDGGSNLILLNTIISDSKARILNTLNGDGDVGISVSSDSNLISQNSISNSTTGIRINNSDSNTVSSNEADNNIDYGIVIEGTSAEFNNILSNTANDNGIFDLYSPDDPNCTSSNNWIGNISTTNDPNCLD